MEQIDIIVKIQKLLALSKSSNENEAQNAMLKAQKLLIKYKLSLQEVESYSKENIKIEDFKTNQKFRGRSWKGNLARVIADNFGCFLYYNTGNYKVHRVCFYGKEEDVIIANIMFEYAVKWINLEGNKLVKRMKQDKRRKYFDGIKSDYALGFIAGLKERFKNQLEENKKWGLVIQKDQVVIDSYTKFSSGFGEISLNEKFNRHLKAYKQGELDGKKFDISDKIENEGENEELKELA
ncbi:MAG: DUF2786 domain-containing protein [Clostridium sp.]|jgi:Protein of unknown function (DUF2786)|uniref:DUF2786 domain-containing protein n=1 Tax=Clostridium tertium TaxID=1559 RepID=UPI003563F9B7|nr:DUF2786 domain-containing protein [Clostridium sp.]